MRAVLVLTAALAAGCAPPLVRAARDGDCARASALLAQGADPETRADGETALIAAASRGRAELVKLLLDKGAKVDARDRWGRTALMRAAERGLLELVKQLVARGADVKARDAQGATPLHYAVQDGQADAARFLLDHGAEVDAADRTSFGATPLGVAAYFGELDVVRLLLERGADPKRPGNNGRTPASQALWRGNFELARLLKLAAAGKPLPPSVPLAPAEPSSAADTPSYRLSEDPHAFAVVVGVGQYGGLPKAPYAERDARAMSAHLRALGYAEDHVFSLSGVQATKAGLAKTLEGRLAGAVDENSTVLFYFAGYGSADPKTRQAYLLPMDGDPDFLAETAYPVARLYEKLAGLRARRALVVLDCAFSGLNGRAMPAKGAASAVETDATGPRPAKVVVLLPSSAGDAAGVLSDQGHGALTYQVLRALNAAGGALSVGAFLERARGAGPPPLLPQGSPDALAAGFR